MARSTLVPASLRYIEQVARSGSIQRAGRELNIAASAINRQILQVEQTLGVKLFERVTKGMLLTPAGDAIVTMGRQWRLDEQRAAAQLQQLQGLNQGHVRLVAMDSHANGCLPPLVVRIAEDHPGISLEIEVAATDAAVASVVAGTADIAAAYNLLPRRDLHVLWSEQLPFGCVVAPTHPLARQPDTSLQEIAACPLALQSRSLMIRRYLESRHAWLFTGGQKIVETNSLQLVKLLAATGRYAAFTSELDAAAELLNGSLIFRPVRDPNVEPQTVSVAIDARRSLPKVGRIVAECLATILADELAAIRRKPAQA
jgi:DNA-binding transcriptional LysR family regulator